MNVIIIPFLSCSNPFVASLFGILVYNDLTSIVTKIELTGTEKLFTLLMKLFVSFIYEGICFTTGWKWGSTNFEISCYVTLN